MLKIDGAMVVDNDGLHSALTKSGTVALEQGLHRFEVGFFEAAGQDDVVVEWIGPGFERQRVPPAAYFH